MTVHNHGPAEGRGLDCPERRIDGKLRGACMFEPPAQAAQDRPRRDETPADGGADGQDAPEPAERHLRDHHQAALDAITEARTTGGTQGTTYALTAIAHALLAQERP